jgi:hypothetical protein
MHVEYACLTPVPKMWAFDDFAAFLEQPPSPGASRMDDLLAEARRLQGAEALQDDFSIIEALFL